MKLLLTFLAGLSLWAFSDTADASSEFFFSDFEAPTITGPSYVSLPANADQTDFQQHFQLWDNQTHRLTLHYEPFSTTVPAIFPTVLATADAAGNIATKIVMVEVQPAITPEIHLADQTITAGDPFEPLAEVSATADGEDITAALTIEGDVDTSTPGDYTLLYHVTFQTQQASKERIITVLPAEPAESTPIETSNSSETQPTATSETEPAADTEAVTAAVAEEPTEEVAATPVTQMQIAGQTIVYQNSGQASGQAVIDADSSNGVATWGGAATYSGSDGANTHFIGHNPGAFSVLFSVSLGSTISVTDVEGLTTTYQVDNIVQVDDTGMEVKTKKDYWEEITGTGGGERITLQTCISDTLNLIIFASAA
ncbi:hypothetical protein RU97_GL002069 [Enterococcus canis]|uniref:Pesticidal crystal protein Cry22Aa Ig-like domain-containing protein n=1 Tax=Enterococcus canis TaxID=214095 RepID=A0A1L8RDZ6_9ENTE|nr:immunoglobulin-like domain-containing protein [Enterococcus canis]OJG17996.1 hypothetical protein RU97_GL002069 [Enterococcus canis]